MIGAVAVIAEDAGGCRQKGDTLRSSRRSKVTRRGVLQPAPARDAESELDAEEVAVAM